MRPFTLESADGYTERDAYIFAQLTEDWEHVGPIPAGGREVGDDEEPPF